LHSGITVSGRICDRAIQSRHAPPDFEDLSRDYFTREAHHDFASEAVVFSLLMMSTVLPLLNGASAVVELIRSTGAAF
jgi:hypothetical protein